MDTPFLADDTSRLGRWTPVLAPARVAVGPPSLEEEEILEAEQALEQNDFAGAVAALDGVVSHTRRQPALTLRALLVEGWARIYLDDLERAEELLLEARELAEGPGFDDLQRAACLYRLGACRLRRTSVGNATELFTVALELCHRASAPCPRLRSHILQWRARCWLVQHLPEMARQDTERAIELAQELGEQKTMAHAFLQASIVAERQSQWLLARMYAEQALQGYQELGDQRNSQIALNNLGGINILLDSHERAATSLERALALALDAEDLPGAGYTVSTLAEMALRTGDPLTAEERALEALGYLEGLEAHLAEHGSALLTLGRALVAQGRLDAAEEVYYRADHEFEQASSIGHRAEGWVAQGDLARACGDVDRAGDRYRKAALALQDVHL